MAHSFCYKYRSPGSSTTPPLSIPCPLSNPNRRTPPQRQNRTPHHLLFAPFWRMPSPEDTCDRTTAGPHKWSIPLELQRDNSCGHHHSFSVEPWEVFGPLKGEGVCISREIFPKRALKPFSCGGHRRVKERCLHHHNIG